MVRCFLFCYCGNPWEGGQLLAVTVYKKGAITLMRRLQQTRRNT